MGNNFFESNINKNSWDEVKIDGWFKALMPPSWEIEDDEEVIIFDPQGFGEIRLSLFVKNGKKKKKQRANEIIEDWVEELGNQYNYDISVFKRTRGVLILSAEFVGSESDGEMLYWRVFPVIGDKISLDICYSCPLEDRNREEQIIEGIIDSIELIEPKVKLAIHHGNSGQIVN